MLFNSYVFILLFLPITFLVYHSLRKLSTNDASIKFLVLASIFFYGWWNYRYVALIIASILLNFVLGLAISKKENASIRKSFLALGITLNLAALGYFKYFNFFVENWNTLIGTEAPLFSIALPLAISFFTFQQIAYLCDVYTGSAKEYRFTHYCLFVTFFPQLIAGPIVHHREMLPQFSQSTRFSKLLPSITMGIAIFSIGLIKKSVLADGIAAYSTPLFNAALAGEVITFFDGWFAALSYTLQLYFDFSGYSDMAIGAALLFGIRLPLNFNSPYRSLSIIEFWRRWHITLSRFLRDYLYIPIGGNRGGSSRRYANLITTMLLGGLWHGAGWTFVAWGLLHGLYLIINHGWRNLLRYLGIHQKSSTLTRLISWTVTFFAVVVGWVFFRAETFDAALIIISGMFGLNGIVLPEAFKTNVVTVNFIYDLAGVNFGFGGGTKFVLNVAWISTLLFIAVFFPNTQQIMRYRPPAPDDRYSPRQKIDEVLFSSLWKKNYWKVSSAWSILIGLLTAIGILSLTSISEFLYFQF
ncbi:MAG: MBOAT family protein [Alphaproteobacteria bacterium]|nr:MBOAT family protein [Alphaproteobacteria bacterium]